MQRRSGKKAAEEASSTEAAEDDEGAAGQAQGVAMEEAEEVDDELMVDA